MRHVYLAFEGELKPPNYTVEGNMEFHFDQLCFLLALGLKGLSKIPVDSTLYIPFNC